MPVERVFVHVGCPKTGTTFLQSLLWRSGDRLREQGLELPLSGPEHHYLALEVLGQEGVALPSGATKGTAARMAQALRDGTSPVVLIDNESLVGATTRQASEFLRMLAESTGGAETHVVITARDFARQAPSEWQQQIRSGRTFTWATFARALVSDDRLGKYFRSGHDPSDVARRWREDLPANNVHIVTLPRRSGSRDVLADRFCSVLGVDASSLDLGVAEHNNSLSFPAAELLRQVNMALDGRLPHADGWYERIAQEFFTHRILSEISSTGRPPMNDDVLRWCVAQSDRIVAELVAADYHIVGDLDELRPEASSVDDSAEETADRLIDVAVAALADLLAGLRDHQTVDALRERVPV